MLPTVSWRGVTLDTRTAAMMNAAVALEPGIRWSAWQGSYSTSVSASAGTHSRAGAIDIGATNMSYASQRAIETAMRRVGFAAWLRFPSQGPWDYHVHGIAIGCTDLAPLAQTQVQNYLDGLSGLSGGGPDTGTRAYVGVTWESYLAGGGSVGSPTPTTPPPAGGEGLVVYQYFLTGAGTTVDAPVQSATGQLELAEARFSPAKIA